MKTEKELEIFKELIVKEWAKTYHKRPVMEWIAVTYTLRTLEYVLEKFEKHPVELILNL